MASRSSQSQPRDSVYVSAYMATSFVFDMLAVRNHFDLIDSFTFRAQARTAWVYWWKHRIWSSRIVDNWQVSNFKILKMQIWNRYSQSEQIIGGYIKINRQLRHRVEVFIFIPDKKSWIEWKIADKTDISIGLRKFVIFEDNFADKKQINWFFFALLLSQRTSGNSDRSAM